MSGRRCKALRRDFARAFGRPPRRSDWKRLGGSWAVGRSEWRLLKRSHKEARAAA